MISEYLAGLALAGLGLAVLFGEGRAALVAVVILYLCVRRWRRVDG